MLSVLYLSVFFTCGVFIARNWLPTRSLAVRAYIGLSVGLLLMMWLPALWACLFRFTVKAHLAALAAILFITALSYLTRERKAVCKSTVDDKKSAAVLGIMVVLLSALTLYLQYTHCLRPNENGGYSVGQSTYGDLSLHTAIASSALQAAFPLHNCLMIGETMAYPYLVDTFASSCMLLGMPLNTAMVFTGTLICSMIYCGYALLCAQLCRKKWAAVFAFLLLFLNGGLGFFYVLDAKIENGIITGLQQNLQTLMNGYYKAPTNQPEPYNLRWVNIICDMLIPQRGFMGGFAMLMPALNLLLPPLIKKKQPSGRATLLLGLFAGGLPLIHTHSFLGLVLLSFGLCLYSLLHEKKENLPSAISFWLQYAILAGVLSIPQLFGFTFRQVSSSNHFLRFWFNWCNNVKGDGKLIDTYLWFYLKNIGLPYVLILLALLKRKPVGAVELPREIYQNRLLACGAFIIYLAVETVKFQPNIYDNNKLLYIWFLLCLPMAADYACEAFNRLKGLNGRWLLAVMALTICFTSSLLTIARECVSDYGAYSKNDIEAADYIRENTEPGCVFLTGNQHLNPVSSLAGRSIVCSSDIYLYYHGFTTAERRGKVLAFYEDPANQLDILRQYQVEYIYVSPYERSQGIINEDALRQLFPCLYENSETLIFAVPEELR